MVDNKPKTKRVHEPFDLDSMPTYPVFRLVSLPAETRTLIIDLVIGIVDRYSTEPDVACKLIKQALDDQYDYGWNAVVGESFGHHVAYDLNHFIYAFTNGNLGVLVWKCLSEGEVPEESDEQTTESEEEEEEEEEEMVEFTLDDLELT